MPNNGYTTEPRPEEAPGQEGDHANEEERLSSGILKEMLEELQAEFDEFREGSAELERELESELDRVEQRARNAEAGLREMQQASREATGRLKKELFATQRELEFLQEDRRRKSEAVRDKEEALEQTQEKERRAQAEIDALREALDTSMELATISQTELEELKRSSQARERHLYEDLEEAHSELALLTPMKALLGPTKGIPSAGRGRSPGSAYSGGGFCGGFTDRRSGHYMCHSDGSTSNGFRVLSGSRGSRSGGRGGYLSGLTDRRSSNFMCHSDGSTGNGDRLPSSGRCSGGGGGGSESGGSDRNVRPFFRLAPYSTALPYTDKDSEDCQADLFSPEQQRDILRCGWRKRDGNGAGHGDDDTMAAAEPDGARDKGSSLLEPSPPGILVNSRGFFKKENEASRLQERLQRHLRLSATETDQVFNANTTPTTAPFTVGSDEAGVDSYCSPLHSPSWGCGGLGVSACNNDDHDNINSNSTATSHPSPSFCPASGGASAPSVPLGSRGSAHEILAGCRVSFSERDCGGRLQQQRQQVEGEEKRQGAVCSGGTARASTSGGGGGRSSAGTVASPPPQLLETESMFARVTDQESSQCFRTDGGAAAGVWAIRGTCDGAQTGEEGNDVSVPEGADDARGTVDDRGSVSEEGRGGSGHFDGVHYEGSGTCDHEGAGGRSSVGRGGRGDSAGVQEVLTALANWRPFACCGGLGLAS